MEDPGYSYGRNAFQLTGNEIVGVPVDDEGIIVKKIPECQLVFTTPSHQFPTMVTMSQSRREELLEAAINQDFLVIEDDYESEMNYFNARSKSLRAQDRNDRVIYIGSLSKTVSPGIRLGIQPSMEATPGPVQRLLLERAPMIRRLFLRRGGLCSDLGS
jgi:GntR family transcriptional regulator/MocR family aminotransferase